MKRKKVEPSALSMNFISPVVTAGAPEQFFIDLSQCASLLNRRFYRQGLNWAVSNIKISAPQNGTIFVQKLPNTWTMSNAWHKGFAAWQKMNNEALEESESVRPRFLDFKIYANARHHNKGFGANLLPITVVTDPAGVRAPAIATPGEWEPSKYIIPRGPASPGNTLEREVIAVGASYPGSGFSTLDAVSLIEGYASSRGLPDIEDPNTPVDSLDATGTVPENWMSALFNDGTSQTAGVLADMITENNLAPYPFENDGVNVDTQYPGGANQLPDLELLDTSFITASTISGTTRIPGSNFPCGLVAITWEPSDVDANIFVEVELVPGHHRGYLCEPMQEM